MDANSRQVGGDHYKTKIEHWDYVLANDIPYLEAQIIKYLTRWRKKNGLQDVLKAKHFLDKLIETETGRASSEDLAKLKPSELFQLRPATISQEDAVREEAQEAARRAVRDSSLRLFDPTSLETAKIRPWAGRPGGGTRITTFPDMVLGERQLQIAKDAIQNGDIIKSMIGNDGATVGTIQTDDGPMVFRTEDVSGIFALDQGGYTVNYVDGVAVETIYPVSDIVGISLEGDDMYKTHTVGSAIRSDDFTVQYHDDRDEGIPLATIPSASEAIGETADGGALAPGDADDLLALGDDFREVTPGRWECCECKAIVPGSTRFIALSHHPICTPANVEKV